jgi:hypothetical protein
MHPTNPATPGCRNERLLRQVNTLETLLRRGWFIEFYDPRGTRYGLPTYPYRFAPDGLLTIRQLRAKGLRPGGQDVAAQILWRHRKHRRVAYLYRADLAKPKRHATTAQLAAIAKALRAQVGHGEFAGVYIGHTGHHGGPVFAREAPSLTTRPTGSVRGFTGRCFAPL